MLRIVVVALFAFSLLLGGCGAANKPISKAQSYVWSVEYTAGNQAVFLCKKVEVAIYRDRRIPNRIDSEVVDDLYCAKMAKPTLVNPANVPG